MSQQRFAATLKVSRVTVARWESGDQIASPGHDAAIRDLLDATAVAAGDTASALALLRAAIVALKPASSDGFEGLLAQALASVSNLTVRIAKSGLQFGRDGASSPSSDFAIAFEAKLYKDLPPSLATLGGKAAIAGYFLSGKVDVWAVGCTAEIGEQITADITALLEREGITVVILDWAERPLPPLAVVLAAAPEATLQWFTQFGQTDERPLLIALRVIAADKNFAAQHEALRKQMQASTAGLDALRRHADGRLRARLRDRRQSQQAFGQWVTVAAPESPALPRPHLDEPLSKMIVPDPQDLAVVAVLGEEGVGKTWLVAQWWSSLPEPPIFCLVPSREGAQWRPEDPTAELAAFFAAQDGRRNDPHAIAAWRRRIKRWKTHKAKENLRFVLVLDGLNERSGAPWPELIPALAQELQALGGMLVLTARKAYWEREVAPRLGGSVEIRTLEVPDYTDVELAAMLTRVGRNLADVPPRVRSFIRNPRVCAVALKLLPQLINADELTVERLLLEYWKERLAERASALRHTNDDFHKVLRLHARAWLTAPKAAFDRDDWVDRSGLTKHLGPAKIANDLTEIEEGRFLTADPSRPGHYVFREATLPFALALLVNDELRGGIEGGSVAADILQQALSPIQSFDRLADVIASAIGLACFDPTFPMEGRRGLIVHWLGLHNVDDESFRTLTAYVPARPDVFLDSAELASDQLGEDGRQQSLIGLLTSMRDHPRVREALWRRAPSWLGRWSRASQLSWRDGKDAERQAERERNIDDAIDSLTRSEADLLRRLTTEVPAMARMNLTSASAMLFAARPQTAIAEGFVGWAMAQVLAENIDDGREDLEWAVRLNVIDWCEVRKGVTALVEGIDASAAPRIRAGKAGALRLLGDDRSAAAADVLSPAIPHLSWRRVEVFCDTDPYDPWAPDPTNLQNAVAAMSRIPADALWLHMSSTGEDLDFRDASPGLIRYDPAVLIAKVRDVIASAPDRVELPLRQLSWHLPDLAPLFGPAERRAVEAALQSLTNDPARIAQSDIGWVTGQIVESLLPGATAQEQLELIQRLPSGSPLYLNLRRGLKPLTPDELERCLEMAATANDQDHLTRTLFFVSGSKPELTGSVRERLLNVLVHGEPMQRHLAAEIAVMADDEELFERFLELIETLKLTVDRSDEGFTVARLVAKAVVSRSRPELIDIVPQPFVGWVAAKLKGAAFESLAAQTEMVLDRLLKPVAATPPQGVEVIYQSRADGFDAALSFAEAEQTGSGFDALVENLNHAERGAARYTERQKAVIAGLMAYRTALSHEDASAVASSPPLQGLASLGEAAPARVVPWLKRILAEDASWSLSQVRNLALALAASVARTHGDLAAMVFRKVWDVRSNPDGDNRARETAAPPDVSFPTAGAGLEDPLVRGARRRIER